jgi:hypothetical protein
MLDEREKIVSVFVFSLFCFGLTLVGTYGVMMDKLAELITSGCTVVCKYFLRAVIAFSRNLPGLSQLWESGIILLCGSTIAFA